MIVLAPPAMISGVAAFPLLMQFVSPVLGLAALGGMVFNGLVELVVNFRHALLAVVCAHERCSGGEGKKSYEHSRRERNLAIERNDSHLDVLSFVLRAGLKYSLILENRLWLRHPHRSVEICWRYGRSVLANLLLYAGFALLSCPPRVPRFVSSRERC